MAKPFSVLSEYERLIAASVQAFELVMELKPKPHSSGAITCPVYGNQLNWRREARRIYIKCANPECSVEMSGR